MGPMEASTQLQSRGEKSWASVRVLLIGMLMTVFVVLALHIAGFPVVEANFPNHQQRIYGIHREPQDLGVTDG